jgi:hypothetical protein
MWGHTVENGHAVQGETNGIGYPFRSGGMAGGIASKNSLTPDMLWKSFLRQLCL